MFTTFPRPEKKRLHLWKTKLFAEQKKSTETLKKNRQFVH